MSSLTISMRDILIEHLDGHAVQHVVKFRDRNHYDERYCATGSLLARGLIRFDGRQTGQRYTYITDSGRAALARALGDWADALERAGLIVEDRGNADPTFAQIFHNRHRTKSEHLAEESDV